MTPSGPTDRRGLRVLSMDECLLLLRQASVGRLGFVHRGEPEVLPVNFGMDGASPVFRSTWGSKLDTASVGGLVALEADDVNLPSRYAWSVVVKGQAAGSTTTTPSHATRRSVSRHGCATTPRSSGCGCCRSP